MNHSPARAEVRHRAGADGRYLTPEGRRL